MVARGEVWWADFGEPFGSEPGYERPVLVVSSDRYNRSRIGTVIVRDDQQEIGPGQGLGGRCAWHKHPDGDQDEQCDRRWLREMMF